MKTLRAEHRHMATVMQLFTAQLDTIEAGELVDPHLVYEIMDYMVTWPDRFHHPREDLIYARVAELDPAGADEVDTLQRDHDNTARRGREVLESVEAWRAGQITGDGLLKLGRDYVEHIYEHMNLEEKVVFPHIESVLSNQDWRDLEAEDQLEAVSLPIFGPRVQREFRNMTRKLRRGLRHSVERQALAEWVGIEAFMESIDAVSMAVESSRHTAGSYLRDAVKDAADMFLENPLAAPWRVALNNARVGFELLGDVAEISRETMDDLVKINQARRDRAELVQRNTRPR
ncbi:MAG: hemerythrin domain-containing protein [Halioglobus sp.]|nr:hemerythrin domain-containing protein [Halioglobus sp.]